MITRDQHKEPKANRPSTMEGMRIGIVSNMAWNISNFRMNVVRELINQGAELYVFAPVDEHVGRFNSLQGVHFIPLFRLKRRGINPFRDLALLMELNGHFKDCKLNCVIQYTIKPNIYGSMAGYLAGVPTLCVVTGLGYSYINDTWIKPLVSWFYKLSFRLTKKVLFENIDDLNALTNSKVLDISKTKLIAGPGINLSEFDVQPIQKNRDKTIFLFIGRLLYDKGIREYVAAAKTLKRKGINADFCLLGPLDKENPSHITDLELASWTSEGNIKYLGHTENVYPFIQNADFIVLPSYREGLPKSVMEAMSMGRPVIVTDVPGCRATVDNGVNGWLCKPKDADDLARCMLEAHHTSYTERHIMGQAGRSKVERTFDDRKIAEEIVATVIEVLKDAS